MSKRRLDVALNAVDDLVVFDQRSNSMILDVFSDFNDSRFNDSISIMRTCNIKTLTRIKAILYGRIHHFNY